MNPSAIHLWQKFLNKHPNQGQQSIPKPIYFGDNKRDANECAELVVRGIKQATASSLWWYEDHKKPLPKVGDKYIVTDWDGNALAIIETIKIELTPFNEITSEFAEIEGEGDKSLAYWKKVHQAFFTREMEPYNKKFDEHMIVICRYFKTIYT